MKLIKIPTTGFDDPNHYLIYKIYLAAHPTGFVRLTKHKLRYLNDGRRVDYDAIYNSPLLVFKGEWAFFPQYVISQHKEVLIIGYPPHMPIIKQARLLKFDITRHGVNVIKREAPAKKVVQKRGPAKTAANGIVLPDGYDTWGNIKLLSDNRIRKQLADRYSKYNIMVVKEFESMIVWAEANGRKKKNWVSFADGWLKRAAGLVGGVNR